MLFCAFSIQNEPYSRILSLSLSLSRLMVGKKLGLHRPLSFFSFFSFFSSSSLSDVVEDEIERETALQMMLRKI